MTYEELKRKCAESMAFRWIDGMMTDRGLRGPYEDDDVPRLFDAATLGAVAVQAADAHRAAYIGFSIVKGGWLGGDLEWFAMHVDGRRIDGGRASFDREPFAYAVVSALSAAPDCRLCRDSGRVGREVCTGCRKGHRSDALIEATTLLLHAREELEDVKAELDSVHAEVRRLRSILGELHPSPPNHKPAKQERSK